MHELYTKYKFTNKKTAAQHGQIRQSMEGSSQPFRGDDGYYHGSFTRQELRETLLQINVGARWYPKAIKLHSPMIGEEFNSTKATIKMELFTPVLIQSPLTEPLSG
jgi:hypothetical protein